MVRTKQLRQETLNNIEMSLLLQQSTMSEINCHNIGKIIKFYPNTQTADIQLQQLKQFNDISIQPTLLCDVPLFIYGNATAYITMPNLEGSTCILLFMDRNIDSFLETGEMYAPATTRMHDITDCIALCTFKTQVDTIENYDNEAITLHNNNASLKLTNKLHFNNEKQDLKDLINQFVTACENITVNTQTGTINNKQTFTDLKTKFEELLQ